MTPRIDYYAILGLTPRATPGEIKRAFRARARELHPDVNASPDAEDRFKEINEAYRVLSNPRLRDRYDASRLDFFGRGADASRREVDPAVEDILRRWRSSPPPRRRGPGPDGPFARRHRRRRPVLDFSFWVMSFSLVMLVMAAIWVVRGPSDDTDARNTESAALTAIPQAGVIEPTTWNVGERPRRIDIWTVLAPDQLGYAALVYPDETLDPESIVELALPFGQSTWDILIFDGYFGARRVNPGGGTADDQLLYLIPQRSPEDEMVMMYGAEIVLVGSSMLTEVEERSRLAVSRAAGQSYAEWIAAVVLPVGSTIYSSSPLEPYRALTLGDWRASYYDLAASGDGSLRVEFRLDGDPAQPPDYLQIDAQR